MKLLEFTLAIGLITLIFGITHIRSNHSLEIAHSTLLSHLKHLQMLALSDDTTLTHMQSGTAFLQNYPAVHTELFVAQHKQSMWQLQLHLGKIYTTNSYSLYIDTPRISPSTHFDSRPMAGDIIAKDMDAKCLSGYNNTNTSVECKNNALAEVRLGERFGVERILLEMDTFCIEKETARMYFDRFGQVYCGKIPAPIHTRFKITLLKGSNHKSICVFPNGIITICSL